MNPRYHLFLLALVTVAAAWWIRAEFSPQWAVHQRAFRKMEAARIEKRIAKLTAEKKEGEGGEAGKKIDARLKTLEAQRREAEAMRPKIRQVMIDGFSRVDRCVTCHLGIDRPERADAPQPFAAHPNLKTLFKFHDPEKMGCTPCHGGLGRATFLPDAHGRIPDWPGPMRYGRETQASCRGCHEGNRRLGADGALLTRGMEIAQDRGCSGCHRIDAAGLDDRLAYKIGPSLASMPSKLQSGFAERWIEAPGAVSPETRMPDFYLDRLQAAAAAAFLASVAAAYDTPPLPFDPGDGRLIEKGKQLFDSLGCVACHSLDAGTRSPGPNLSRTGSKLRPEWIYRWLLDPKSYDRNSRMPDFRLSGSEAAALTAWVYSRKAQGAGQTGPETSGLSEDDLKEIAFRRAKRNWIAGIRERRAREKKRPLRALELEKQLRLKEPALREEAAALSGAEKKAAALEEGRRLVREYGCYGCHDIPTFEGTPRLAADLTEFGLKRADKLSFGDLTRVRRKRALANLGGEAIPAGREWLAEQQKNVLASECAPDGAESEKRDGEDVCFDETSAASWIFHKLKTPRVWEPADAALDETKRLRMPDFGFDDGEAKAVRVFLMSLGVDEASEAGGARKAPGFDSNGPLAKGRVLVQKYNCEGCHRVEGRGGSLRSRYDGAPHLAPPDLTGEGERVQSSWLFGFLKKPFVLRPQLTVRMPTFGFEDDEATAIVSYFAAQAGRTASYAFIDPASLDPEGVERGAALFEEFKCLQCHEPGSDPSHAAPDLRLTARRLRPDWTLRWLKNPMAIQPDTRMPNYFYDEEGEPFYDDADRMMEDLVHYLSAMGFERGAAQAPPREGD